MILAAPRGRNYYVDSVGGNDASNGLSFANRKQTIGSLPSPLPQGSRVFLERGSYWRESFETSSKRITVEARGTGNDPVLDSRDEIDNTSWSLYSSMNSTYSTPIIFEGNESGVVTWVSAWENETRMRLGTDQDSLNPGEYFPTSHTSGSATLYVRLSDNSSPLLQADGYIQFSARHSGVKARTAGGITLKNITTIANTNNNGSIETGPNALIIGCKALEGTKHNLYFGEWSVLIDVEARNTYYGGNQAATQYVYNQNVGHNGNVTFIRCKAIQDTTYPSNPNSAWFGHTNTDGDFGTIIYEDCEVNNVSPGIAGGGSGGIIVNNFTSINSMEPFRITSNAIINGANILVDDGRTVLKAFTFTDNDIVTVDNVNICLLNGSATNAGLFFINSDNVDLTVRNMLVDGDGGGNGTVIYLTGEGTTVDIQNSAFDLAGGRYYDIGAGGANPTGLSFTSENNCFEDPNRGSRWDGTSHATVSAWQTGSGKDGSSTTGSCGVAEC